MTPIAAFPRILYALIAVTGGQKENTVTMRNRMLFGFVADISQFFTREKRKMTTKRKRLKSSLHRENPLSCESLWNRVFTRKTLMKKAFAMNLIASPHKSSNGYFDLLIINTITHTIPKVAPFFWMLWNGDGTFHGDEYSLLPPSLNN